MSEFVEDDIFLPDGRLRLEQYDDTARAALQAATGLARDTRWDNVRSPHVFMGLLACPDQHIANWGERLGADLANVLALFQELFHRGANEPEAYIALHREFLSDNVLRLLRDAHQRALGYQREQVSSMDILICMLTAPNNVVTECFERMKQPITAAKLTELAVMAEQQGA
ncbi:MAG: hypothetical protein AB7K24_28725 [Gemmataceae bacterium]